MKTGGVNPDAGPDAPAWIILNPRYGAPGVSQHLVTSGEIELKQNPVRTATTKGTAR
jgi:hypothetical protein